MLTSQHAQRSGSTSWADELEALDRELRATGLAPRLERTSRVRGAHDTTGPEDTVPAGVALPSDDGRSRARYSCRK